VETGKRYVSVGNRTSVKFDIRSLGLRLDNAAAIDASLCIIVDVDDRP
jgi:hypothetical protein